MRPIRLRRVVTLNGVAPQTIALNLGLGRLYGRGINGQTGTVRYGEPALGDRRKFTGYAFPPQLFIGYSARRAAAGAIRPTPPAFPSTTSPQSAQNTPTARAMATVGARQMRGA